MKLKDLLCSIIAITVVFFMAHVYADDLAKEIFISNPWVQAMPPSQKTTAAYMVITNNSNREAIITSASSDIAGTAELYQMAERNGLMSMAMVNSIHVPARGKVALEQDGYHIMLIDLKKPVKKGDIVYITLHFQDGTSVIADAEVKMQEANDSSSMPGMNM